MNNAESVTVRYVRYGPFGVSTNDVPVDMDDIAEFDTEGETLDSLVWFLDHYVRPCGS